MTDTQLERQVAAALAVSGIAPSDAVIVACSGGSDSAALVLLCAANAYRNLHVAYVRHGLRPATVEQQEIDSVAALAARISAPFHTTERPDRLEDVSRDGIEAAARHHRYRQLGAIAATVGASAVLTAHHRDDAAETALMWLASGRPIEEFVGIRASVVLGGIAVHRPLLQAEHADLVRYVRFRGVVPCVDATNSDHRYRRNAVRQALGLLRDTHPSLNAGLADLAQRTEPIAAITEWALVEAARLTNQRETASATRWDIDAVLALPAAVRAGLIRRQIYRLDPNNRSNVTGALREFERIAAITRRQLETWLNATPTFGAVQLGLDRSCIVLERAVVRVLESGYLFRVAPGSVLRFTRLPKFSRPACVDSSSRLDEVVRIDGLTEPIVCRSVRSTDRKGSDRHDRFDAVIDDAVGPVARIGPNGVRNLQHNPAADGVSVWAGYAGGRGTG